MNEMIKVIILIIRAGVMMLTFRNESVIPIVKASKLVAMESIRIFDRLSFSFFFSEMEKDS